MKAKLTDADKADIIRMAGKGKAIAVLAEDFGVTEQAIRYTIKKGLKKAPAAAAGPDQALGEALEKQFSDKAYSLKNKDQHAEDLFKNTLHPVSRLSIKLDTATLAERMTSKIARDNFRQAAKNLSQAMLRDELTEALKEFFPEKPL